MKLWTGFLIVLAGIANVVFGQGQAEETLPGFKPTGVLENRGVDNVNPFNGDPGVIVPLGPEYSLGPGSKWQLQAYYSSKFWHYDDIPCGLDPSVRHAFITGYPTLGVGWSLELGYIGAGIYHSSTGRHVFKSGGTTACSATNTYCTVDGTHLRVKYISSSVGYTVEFPDGSKHTFGHSYTPPYKAPATTSDFREDDWGVTPGARYGLTEIVDAFGTVLLTVTYVTSPSTDVWKVSSVNLTPNDTPTRKIAFTWTTNTVGSSTWPVLDKATFPSSAGQTLTVDFSFLSNPVSFPRSSWDNSASYSCPTGHPVEVPFLSKIDFQDSGGASLWTYNLLYNLPGTNVAGDGALREITLPTAGKIQYAYGGTAGVCEPSPGCPDPETGAATAGPANPLVPNPIPYLDRSPGILSRTEVDPFTNLNSTVTYQRQNFIPLDSQGNADLTRVARWAVVTAPSGNGTGTIATRYVYRMETADFSAASGLEIARRYYAENVGATGTPIRAVIKCWETDSTSAPKCGYRAADGTIIGTLTGLNPRLQKSVTWYGVNPTGGGTCPGGSGASFCLQSSSSTYVSDAGKYKTTEITTNLMSMAGWTKRSTTTNWTPQTVTPWLLNLFSSTSVTDTVSSPPVPNSVSTTYSFSTANGFLNSTTTADGSNGTLTRTFTSTNGNPTADTASGTSGLSGSFTDNRSFQSGLVTSIQRSSIAWKSFDVLRDGNSGVITESRDPNYSTINSTLKTSYTYDALGRLTTVSVPGESTLRACYLNPVGAYPFFTIAGKGLASTCPKDEGVNGAPPTGGWTTTVEGYQYDGFGRVIREIRRLPNAFTSPNDTYFARRETRYDAAGHRRYLSEWTGCTKDTNPQNPFKPTDISSCAVPMPVAAGNPGTGTTWSNFDPFGRPRQLQRADGTTTAIDYIDDGVTPNITHSDSLQKITVNGVAGTNPVTKIREDVLGRVIFVREPSIGGSADTTDYKYNVLDKLAEVKQIRSSITQTRSFTYDKFAFLRSEKHPEKWDANAQPSPAPVTTTYSYDAVGNVTTKSDGSPAVSYSFTYDAAGRLTKESVGTSGYVVNCYDGSATNATCADGTANSSGGSYYLGHRSRSIGTNFIPTVATQVIDDFEWSNAAGRLTLHKSAVGNGGLGSTTTDSWTYTALGLEDTYYHPRASGSFPVTTSYSTGLPTKVVANSQTVAQSVKYNPAGGLASWTAGNTGTAIVTTISQDTSTMMPRPSRIQANTTPAFDTGTYTYDGAGNITAGGDSGDSFTYDARSRLLSGTLSSQTRNFAYDGFGNLTQNGGFNFTVDLANNHLTSGSPTYDTRGNLTYYSGDTMSFDAIDRQYRNQNASSDWVYLYDGAGERAVKFGGSAYVLRREMARYIAEANLNVKSGWTPLPSACPSAFPGDVPCSPTPDPDVRHINLLAAKGVAAGCGGTNFCPNTPVTRAQMAAFVVKGYKQPDPFTLPPCQPADPVVFADVPCSGSTAQYKRYIEQLAADQVTAGCGGGNFCPNANVTEWQILVWLSKVPGIGSGVSWAAYHPVPRGATNGVTYLTLRDGQNRVATELRGGNAMDATSASLSVIRDNVFLGNLLVGYYDASSGPATWWFVVSDHLGSPRRLFKKDLSLTESHKYWPYGEDTSTTVPAQKLAFALMERNDGATRFYDHARHQDYNLGRFLSPDKLGGKIPDPQSWNRYAYARSNPLKYIDLNGQDITIATRFTGNTGLALRQQVQIARDVGTRFSLAGVRNVTVTLNGATVFKTAFDRSANLLGRDVKVDLNIKASDKAIDNAKRMGHSPFGSNDANVSLKSAPQDAAGRGNFAVNVGAHESGHATGDLPTARLLDQGAEPGSVMAPGTPDDVSGELRVFGPSDAESLRLYLNGFTQNTPCGGTPQDLCTTNPPPK